ncbi:MAG: hypothetical protein ACM3IK_10490 [Sphingomonadaceae bacterium]
MFARIGIWRGNAEDLERWVTRSRREVRPMVETLHGVKGAFWLLDREGAKALTITLWESAEAMRKSDERAATIQMGTSEASGARFTTERYEIVEHFLKG